MTKNGLRTLDVRAALVRIDVDGAAASRHADASPERCRIAR